MTLLNLKDNDNSTIHVTPELYSVYVLQLISKPKSFYVGSTPDPNRRLRQHNGDLKAGGAYKTLRKDFRPWKIVALVYGFPSKVSALQFEHALQHPHITRHIPKSDRISKSTTGSLHHRLGNIRLLRESKLFRTFALKLMIIKDAEKEWLQNRFKLVSNVSPIVVDSIDSASIELKQSTLDEISSHFERFKNAVVSCPVPCRYCNVLIDVGAEQPDPSCIKNQKQLTRLLKDGSFSLLAISLCSCSTVSHLSCFAKDANTEKIIPQLITCTQCNTNMNWAEVVRLSTKLRQYLISDILESLEP